MEDFATSVADLSQQIERRQAELQRRLARERSRLEALQQLLRRAEEARDVFDEEDCDVVRREIAAREAELQQLQQESDRREAVRRGKEAVFLQLHRAIEARVRVLDEVDGQSSVLSENEPLLQYFASKQVALTTLLRANMSEMAAY